MPVEQAVIRRRDNSVDSGVDSVSSAGTLKFNPGETLKTGSIIVCGCNVIEANETMVLRLSNPVGATRCRQSRSWTNFDDN